MRYSYEYKRRCVELYWRREWSESPDGSKLPKDFHNMVRRWARMEEANGPEALKHKGSDKEWSPEEKLELVSRVLAGASNQSVAIEAGVAISLLYKWVRYYKAYRRGRERWYSAYPLAVMPSDAYHAYHKKQ